eukprot:jgi/Galph1/228/GphlegSOOS_G4889.1
MVTYNLKRIHIVPSAKELIDIVLSKTQRKTPTVIHKQYAISRIRQFYMRKVKFAQQSFHDKLSEILEDFPKVDEIHPFYADLLNVLYDRDHYKLALGQLAKAKTMIDNLSKEYVRLLKYGDSLYRCKMLKRAAVGRMCTLIKRLASSFAYLEQVRQHMARLPTIDPHGRCLIIAGYPNVGKSSFMNLITRANVDVQPYPFTTKSLFVGHMDYKYLRWQVIDTPGILDKPLEERNTIEMQSITALAHLKATVLFFIDPSEHCGFSIEQQISLFKSLGPLFVEKPIILVCNKTDLDWQPEIEGQLQSLVYSKGQEQEMDEEKQLAPMMMKMSTLTKTGVMEVRNAACDLLLEQRVDSKVRGQRAQNILNRLHVAIPSSLVNDTTHSRPPVIPASVLEKKKYAMEKDNMEGDEPSSRPLERDLEAKQGGPGVYSSDWNKQYILAIDEWKYDVIPEIYDGHNILDFVDPDIEERLIELEEEEVARNAIMNIDDAENEVLDEETRNKLQMIRNKTILARNRTKSNNPIGATQMNRGHPKYVSELKQHLIDLGMDDTLAKETSQQVIRNRSVSRKRSRSVSQSRLADSSRSVSVSYQWNDKKVETGKGFRNIQEKQKALSLARSTIRRISKKGRKGEADRKIWNEKPKHLFSGKRKMGKTQRR